MDTSYLTQQVTTIIGQLHGLFDDIGVPSHERDSREAELFSALSETLHSQLKLVTNEKHELTEEIRRLALNIRKMENALEDRKQDLELDGSEITYPLTRCLQSLKEKHNSVSKMHRERYEQVQKLAEALESYSSYLEPSFVNITLPPTSPDAKISLSVDLSPSYVEAIEREFDRVYSEYMRRINMVQIICDEIIKLWAELGTPQAQTDSSIIELARDAPEQLGLAQDDLARLRAKKDKLVEEKRSREKRIKDLRATIESLWDRLNIDEAERKQFLAANRGCGLRTINEYEDMLAKLNELKRQNLHVFVEDARCRLQELWDSLYFSEDEMLDFTPAFSDVYSDALLSAHEAEIARLEALREQRAPILDLIDKHRSLIKDRDDLQASSQDASRLLGRSQKGEKRDPTRLLREEKMRKRIAKELPKVEAELKRTLEDWEEEYGRPFLVRGERYLDELEATSAKAPPARSKTPAPSAHPPAKPMPKSTGSAKPAHKVSGGTLRGSAAPPSRAKTPNFGSSIRGNPFGQSISSSSLYGTAQKSPSRIPARAPLRTMPAGNNSPERGDQTIRSRMGPPRAGAAVAPPPKMKDLFIPPHASTPRVGAENSSMLYTPDVDGSMSIVRHVSPEDVYDDRTMTSSSRCESRMGMSGLTMMNTSLMGHSTIHTSSMLRPSAAPRMLPREYGHRHAPSIVSHASSSSIGSSSRSGLSSYGSRAVSGSSSSAHSAETGNTTVSGSENWETYEDDEDEEGYSECGRMPPEEQVGEEEEGQEIFYRKVRAPQHPQQQKRGYEGSFDGLGGGAGKRVRSREWEGRTAVDVEVGEMY